MAKAKRTKQERIESYLTKNPDANIHDLNRALPFTVVSSQLATARKRLGITAPGNRNKQPRAGAPAPRKNGGGMTNRQIITAVFKLADECGWEKLENAVDLCKKMDAGI